MYQLDSVIAVCYNLNEKKILSVRTEESVVVVEDVGSSQGECVTQTAGAGEWEFSRNRLYVPVQKCAEKCGKGEVGESGVSLYWKCMRCCRFGCTVVCGLQRLYQGWGKHPMPGERAAITADEADESVEVVGNSTPVHSDMESEGFTFRESVSYVFSKNLGGVLDTSGLPLF